MGTKVTSEQREPFAVAREGGIWTRLSSKSWQGTHHQLVFLLAKWTYFPRQGRGHSEQQEEGPVRAGWPANRGCPWEGTSHHGKKPTEGPHETKSQHLNVCHQPLITTEASLKDFVLWALRDLNHQPVIGGSERKKQTLTTFPDPQPQVPKPKPASSCWQKERRADLNERVRFFMLIGLNFLIWGTNNTDNNTHLHHIQCFTCISSFNPQQQP